jgi:YgiT-type zinc finger domain-containing protein
MNKLNHKADPIQCVNCGHLAAYLTRRSGVFGRGSKAIIIEDIPTIVCRNCGLSYLTPEVSRKIDEIRAQPEKYTEMEYRAVAKIA